MVSNSATPRIHSPRNSSAHGTPRHEYWSRLLWGESDLAKVVCSSSLTPRSVNKDYATAEITYSSEHVLPRSLLGQGLLCAVALRELHLKGGGLPAAPRRGPGVRPRRGCRPGQEGTQRAAPGAPPAPSAVPAPGSGTARSVRTVRRPPFPPPEGPPSPGLRTASVSCGCYTGVPLGKPILAYILSSLNLLYRSFKLSDILSPSLSSCGLCL